MNWCRRREGKAGAVPVRPAMGGKASAVLPEVGYEAGSDSRGKGR